jgi:phage tail tape-measure protein
MEWFTKITALVGKIRALESSVETLVSAHGELVDDAKATFAALVAAMATKTPMAMFAFVGAIEKAYADGMKAYNGSADSLKDLLAQLKGLAN